MPYKEDMHLKQNILKFNFIKSNIKRTSGKIVTKNVIKMLQGQVTTATLLHESEA